MTPEAFISLLDLCLNAAASDKSPVGVVAVLQLKAPIVLKSLGDIEDPQALATQLEVAGAAYPALKDKITQVVTLCRDPSKSKWFEYFLEAAQEATNALAEAGAAGAPTPAPR